MEMLIPKFIEPSERKGKKLVFCNGVFDLLHIGHVRMLQKARELGDMLVVAVNSDASVRTLGKGDDRPIVPENERVEMLSALECVDFVLVFEEPTPLEVINRIRPDIICKASDWADKYIVGSREVASWGGRVEVIPLEAGYSTTKLIERIRRCNLQPAEKEHSF